MWAVEQGQIASLERANTFGLNIMETVYKSSVTVAIEAGQDSALTWLLDQGASVNQQNNTVWCNISGSQLSIPQYALHLAFNARCPSAVLILLSRGASLEYTMRKKCQDGQLVHAMTEAIEHGMLSVVDHLVTYCGVSVNDQSLTPLYLAAAQLPGQDDIVNYLLDNGASINFEVGRDMLGFASEPQTALSVAMYSTMWTSQSFTAILLISHGASLEYVNYYVLQSMGNKNPKQHALVKAIQLELVDLFVYLVTAHNIDLKKPNIGEYTDDFERSVAQCTQSFCKYS